jgi:hypothetical protein
MEVAATVVLEDDRLAVDQRLVRKRPRTASAILRKRSVKSAARRLQTRMRSPCFQARTRKPSYLTSCSQPGPAGGRRGSDQGLAAARQIEGGMSAWTKAGGATH